MEGSPGGYMRPTLLVDVTPEMDIARNEVFGPVMVMMKAQDDEDALRIVSIPVRLSCAGLDDLWSG